MEIEELEEKKKPAVSRMKGKVLEMPNLEGAKDGEAERELVPVTLAVWEAPGGTFSPTAAKGSPKVAILATKQELRTMQEEKPGSQAFEFQNLENAPEDNPYGAAYMTPEAARVMNEVKKGGEILEEKGTPEEITSAATRDDESESSDLSRR